MPAVERGLRRIFLRAEKRVSDAEKKFALQRAARFLEKAELAAHRAEIRMRDDMVWSQPGGLPIAGERGLELTFGVACRAEIVPGFGESRMKAQRPAIAGDRFAELAAILEHVAEIVVIRGDARVALDRAAQRALGGVEPAAAPMFEGLDVQRVGGIELAA